MNTPQETQIGGTHYKDLAIQPATFITANKLSFLEGCVVKRMCRHRRKNGIEDLREAIHEIELMIELEYGKEVDAEDAAVAASRSSERMSVMLKPMIFREEDKLDALSKLPMWRKSTNISITPHPQEWHNPENVTQEQLGEGYRFLVPWEVANDDGGLVRLVQSGKVAQWCKETSKWSVMCTHVSDHCTYSIDVMEPIPPKP